MTSVPEVARTLARIQNWQNGNGHAMGRADASRRLDEANKLLGELTDKRRAMLVAGNSPQ